MEDMKLPMSDKFPESNRWLSMEEYFKFVNFILKSFPRQKMTKKEWVAMHSGARFSLK